MSLVTRLGYISACDHSLLHRPEVGLRWTSVLVRYDWVRCIWMGCYSKWTHAHCRWGYVCTGPKCLAINVGSRPLNHLAVSHIHSSLLSCCRRTQTASTTVLPGLPRKGRGHTCMVHTFLSALVPFLYSPPSWLASKNILQKSCFS